MLLPALCGRGKGKDPEGGRGGGFMYIDKPKKNGLNISLITFKAIPGLALQNISDLSHEI